MLFRDSALSGRICARGPAPPYRPQNRRRLQVSRTKREKTAPREKKSFTLSPESIAFLAARRARERAPSTSAVLEEILQAARREQELDAQQKAVVAYYDSLSAKDADEQAKWGDFALEQFPPEVA